VQLDATCNCCYFTEVPVSVGDKVVVSTKHGITIGHVTSIVEEVSKDPWEEGRAKQRVLENATQKLYYKESVIMFGAKTVEVKHVSSNRTGIFYTDLTLSKGDTVVYDSGDPSGLHVGIVVDTDPDVVTAMTWIVDTVDMTSHQNRLAKVKEAAKLKARLDSKREQFQDIELLRLIAASDPETKEMLDAYTKLISGK
jgi:hypothetical protein